MPIYEYECGSCGRYEELQKITEPAHTHCRKCNAPVRKLVSQSSFTLKGGGWYKDLYGSPNSGGGKANGKPNEAAKVGGDKAEAKAEPGKADSSKSDSSKADSAKSESSKTESKASSSTSSASDAKSPTPKKSENKSAAA